MHCRYCGTMNPEGEQRCVKCQRRISVGAYSVIETAIAPKLAPAASAHPSHRLTAVIENAGVERRTRPTQQDLFAHDDGRKIVAMPGAGAPARTSRPDSNRSRSRRSAEGQTAFDFSAPAPAQPFHRERSRRNVFPVAPLPVRAVAVLVDTGIVTAALVLMVAVIRTLLGQQLVLDQAMLPYAAIALLSIGLCYKLVWCLFCRPTIGLQLMRLRVVDFSGQLPSLGQCILRILTGYMSFTCLGMGLAWAVVDDEQLTWHDHISQTYLTLHNAKQ